MLTSLWPTINQGFVPNVPVVPIVQAVSSKTKMATSKQNSFGILKAVSGIPSHVLPSNSRPFSFFLLFEEKRNALSDASVPDFSHPLRIDVAVTHRVHIADPRDFPPPITERIPFTRHLEINSNKTSYRHLAAIRRIVKTAFSEAPAIVSLLACHRIAPADRASNARTYRSNVRDDVRSLR